MPILPKPKRAPWLPERKAWVHPTRRDDVYQSKRWKELRVWYRMHNPLCVQCGDAMYVVDHITPMSQGGAAWDVDNLQSLCRRCHDAKTASESKNKGEGP